MTVTVTDPNSKSETNSTELPEPVDLQTQMIADWEEYYPNADGGENELQAASDFYVKQHVYDSKDVQFELTSTHRRISPYWRPRIDNFEFEWDYASGGDNASSVWQDLPEKSMIL